MQRLLPCEPFTPIDEAGAMELIQSSDWCAQEELDGARLRLHGAGGRITAWDRLGKVVAIPGRLKLSALALGLDCLLDGELVDDTFHAFDLLELAGGDLTALPLRQRLDRLSDLLHGRDRWSICQVATARLRWEKETLFEVLRGERRKGIVFKPLGEPCWSGEGERAPSSRKLSFRPSMTGRVIGFAGARRIVVKGLSEHGRPVSCTVKIPDDHHLPPVGTMVEIAHRGVTASSELIVPVFIRRREDIE
ncbi:hypothetical protein [Luteolibacter sp. LG18]|uniref:hypothetical protein n=1 Tax=Luteolibacter sp. LG18 TaxID=2819286 RepID=UPI002B2A7497|nr:hypothetical protein llg_43100 [Luteolibacter sp. LG18]